jgi:hypothetical protein
MKFLHLNTASAFTSDYKLFSYQSRQSEWDPTEAVPIELWDKYCPSGLALFGHNLNLGYRSRSFSMWICRNESGPGHFCAFTITGMASDTRKDFMGRIIYDSLSLIHASDQDEFEQDARHFAGEQACIALNALAAFSDKNWSLDSAANQDDFDKDAFAFSDIGRVYSLLSVSRECDIRADITEEAGVAQQLVLQLLKSLAIDFSIEENVPSKGVEPNGSYLGDSSLREQLDESIGNMAEAAEELRDEIEDRFTGVLGEQYSRMLLQPFRLVEGFFKRGQSAQVEQSRSSPKRGAKASHPGSNCLYIACRSRPSPDTASQLQNGLLSIWASNPSVAIGLSIACPLGDTTSSMIDAHKQVKAVIITSP